MAATLGSPGSSPAPRSFRADPDGRADDVRRVDISTSASLTQGSYTWRDAAGTQLYARNRALIVNGRYHVVVVFGPATQRDQGSEIYEQTVASYRATP